MLTKKQREIISFLKEGQKTKAEIVENFKGWYYYNSSKHIGDVLGRMVMKNLIIRVKKGVYSLNTHLTQNTNNQSDNIENQLSLFR